MSQKPKDHRPRVISFRTSIYGLNIAASDDILWPCHAFSISIPQNKKSILNIFEETVLKLTEIESGETDKLAEITCLEKELIIFIQNRLNHLGLVDDRYELSEYGAELMNEWNNQSEDNLEYIVATVFVDLLNGKLLPYINIGQLTYNKIVNISKSGSVQFLLKATNEKSRISARPIHPDKNSFWNILPDTNDIIRTIRAFKKKYKQHTLLNQGRDQYPPSVPMAEAISVHDNPELVYLHCKIFVQTGNSDLLVTDGCGFGFSESFAGYLTSRNWKWVIDLKSKGVIDRLSPNQRHTEPKNKDSYLDTFKRYPNIKQTLRRAHEHFINTQKIDVDSSNAEQELARLTGLTVISLYAAIEFALRIVVSENSVIHWERLFSSQSYRENDKILRSFATKVGFDVSEKVKSLLQVKPGKIRAIDRGVSEMQPLLALTIAGAINDGNHPLHRLAAADSDFLSLINTLKRIRDPVSHGNSIDIELSLSALKGYFNRTVRLILSLIPEISKETLLGHSQQNNNISQVRLKARIELDKSLGLDFVQSTSPALREELIRLTVLDQEQSLDGELSQRYINLLASIMQRFLFDNLENRMTSAKMEDDIRETALRKIVESGFYSTTDEIPVQISTVNAMRIHRAVHGSSTTLGAHLLALFLIGTECELKKLKNLDTAFIDFVAKLISLRGHGNKSLENLPQNDLEILKNKVFKAIKMITEVF